MAQGQLLATLDPQSAEVTLEQSKADAAVSGSEPGQGGRNRRRNLRRDRSSARIGANASAPHASIRGRATPQPPGRTRRRRHPGRRRRDDAEPAPRPSLHRRRHAGRPRPPTLTTPSPPRTPSHRARRRRPRRAPATPTSTSTASVKNERSAKQRQIELVVLEVHRQRGHPRSQPRLGPRGGQERQADRAERRTGGAGHEALRARGRHDRLALRARSAKSSPAAAPRGHRAPAAPPARVGSRDAAAAAGSTGRSAAGASSASSELPARAPRARRSRSSATSDSMQLVVPLSESEVGNVKVGQIATVTVEALEGRKLAGTRQRSRHPVHEQQRRGQLRRHLPARPDGSRA